MTLRKRAEWLSYAPIDRPSYVVCVRVPQEPDDEYPEQSLCGRGISAEFHLTGPDHALNVAARQDRLLLCPQCVEVASHTMGSHVWTPTTELTLLEALEDLSQATGQPHRAGVLGGTAVILDAALNPVLVRIPLSEWAAPGVGPDFLRGAHPLGDLLTAVRLLVRNTGRVVGPEDGDVELHCDLYLAEDAS